eukprot:c17719_g1_i1.p1 GENE.c17719_g1_i1~~c17719_g1_i1.p1  ORF type:complete len:425 (-),score=92.10 c17719_g1_i1:537-1811(-)
MLINLNLLNGSVPKLTDQSERSYRKQKQQKLDENSLQCHEITPEIFLSGYVVAQNKALLKQHGITHILNVAGGNCANCHPNDFTYLVLFLNDNSQTDIECVFYDIIDFLKKGTTGGNKTLVHCFQGVSRSATAVLSFIMFSKGWTFESALEFLKQRRSIVKPNAFFCNQLISFERRLKSGVAKPRIYEIALLASHQPDVLAARVVGNPTVPIARAFESVSSAVLRSDTCFLLQCPSGVVFIWKGKRSSAKALEAAKTSAIRILRHEHAQKIIEVSEGHEKHEFWNEFEDHGKHFDPEDRSKAALPPLYQGDGLVQEVVPEVTPDRHSHRPEMWMLPQKQGIEMYDHDDLLEDGVFVLFDRSQPARPIFVWVGRDSPSAEESADVHAVNAQQFLHDLGFDYESEIRVIYDGDDEDDEFDDYFKYD